jgi:hypothetical protein
VFASGTSPAGVVGANCVNKFDAAQVLGSSRPFAGGGRQQPSPDEEPLTAPPAGSGRTQGPCSQPVGEEGPWPAGVVPPQPQSVPHTAWWSPTCCLQEGGKGGEEQATGTLAVAAASAVQLGPAGDVAAAVANDPGSGPQTGSLGPLVDGLRGLRPRGGRGGAVAGAGGHELGREQLRLEQQLGSAPAEYFELGHELRRGSGSPGARGDGDDGVGSDGEDETLGTAAEDVGVDDGLVAVYESCMARWLGLPPAGHLVVGGQILEFDLLASDDACAGPGPLLSDGGGCEMDPTEKSSGAGDGGGGPGQLMCCEMDPTDKSIGAGDGGEGLGQWRSVGDVARWTLRTSRAGQAFLASRWPLGALARWTLQIR